MPLDLLGRILGVQIISSRAVWTGGPFLWNRSIAIRQYGITVKRGKSGTQIRFSSGQTRKLDAGAPWQLVEDPSPQSVATPHPIELA